LGRLLESKRRGCVELLESHAQREVRRPIDALLEKLRAGRRGTVTCEVSTPLSRRRETVVPWQYMQVTERERMKGEGIGDILLGIDFLSPLQEKRGNGLMATTASIGHISWRGEQRSMSRRTSPLLLSFGNPYRRSRVLI
jgi:hypothetical protein